jgi:hypothetical protein
VTKVPVPVTGIWLARAGDRLVVRAEVDGRWRDVISEFDPYVPDASPPHSHIVEAAGILSASPTPALE